MGLWAGCGTYLAHPHLPTPCQHLVTLSLGETEDLRTVEDAVRKLGEMDTQGHLWAQEMLLQVTSSTIKLSDVDSKVGAGG